MTGSIARLAVCSAIYPAAKPFLAEWYRSLMAQTDSDTELWVALDGMDVESAVDAMGGDPRARWIQAAPGDTPAQVRQRILERVVRECDGVVLVDCDDILLPHRVASARRALVDRDLSACPMRLVDAQGLLEARSFGLSAELCPSDVLPRCNAFGLSNTAWRTALLKKCLPVPRTILIVDWFLATRAWLCGARLGFESEAGMDYRQHGSNMVQICPPYTTDQVVQDADRARHHFATVLSTLPEGAIPERVETLGQVAEEIDRFSVRLSADNEVLVAYVAALNALDPAPLWWVSVANPQLRYIWNQ